MLVCMLPRHVGKLIVLGCVVVAAGEFVCLAHGAAQQPVTPPTPLPMLRLDGGTAAVPLIDQAQHTPMLVLGVLLCCLAAAFLALWRAARDYRVFRVLGLFYLFVGSEQFLRDFGGDVPYWSMRALAS